MSLLPYSLPPPGPAPTPSSREVSWGCSQFPLPMAAWPGCLILMRGGPGPANGELGVCVCISIYIHRAGPAQVCMFVCVSVCACVPLAPVPGQAHLLHLGPISSPCVSLSSALEPVQPRHTAVPESSRKLVTNFADG